VILYQLSACAKKKKRIGTAKSPKIIIRGYIEELIKVVIISFSSSYYNDYNMMQKGEYYHY